MGEDSSVLTSLLSLSMCTRNVGSSFWKRLSAREKLGVSNPTGFRASEMTGSGTYIEVLLIPASAALSTAQKAGTHHRIAARAVREGIARRAVDAEYRADFPRPNLLDVLRAS